MKALAISVMALASFNVQAETLRVTDLEVENVSVQGSVEVQIEQGETTELLIRGDQDKLDMQPFYTRGETLVLGHSEQHKGTSFSSVKYMLTLPDVNEIWLSGSGDIFVKPFETDELLLAVDGSGDIKLFSVVAREVKARVRG